MKRSRRLVVVVASLLVLSGAVFAAASLARSSAAPQTTQECHKVKVCVHVVGPWVAVPGTGEATWLLECSKRQGSVGGTDARASSVHVHVWFDGQIGAPISQGVTTGSFLLFHAVTDNGQPGSFEPLLGCIPVKKQSASRSTLSARRISAGIPGTPVGVPLQPRGTLVVLQAGSKQTTSQSCQKKETLVGSWNGLAFGTKDPPTDVGSVLGSVTVKTSAEGTSVKAAIQTGGSLPLTDEAEVQIGAVCAP
ncbi:MAG TPA: hypothetical protein VG652_01660 [Gaiellaceae bacterium]|nr:hypothetical protein [Gaiellaceae bacterium]